MARKYGLAKNIDVSAACDKFAGSVATRFKADIAHRDCDLDEAAAENVRDAVAGLWVETRDHAPHRFLAVCPKMALEAIHKIWKLAIHVISLAIRSLFIFFNWYPYLAC